MSWSYRRVVVLLLALGGAALFAPEAARAYGGPGSIVSGFGALLAAIAAIGAAIFGFLWFPMKRLMRKFRDGSEEEATGAKAGSGSARE